MGTRKKRKRMNKKARIRQRNRRLLLVLSLLCLIVWAGVVNWRKLQEKDKTQEAYKEQQAEQNTETANSVEVKVVKAASDDLVLASEEEKQQWYLKLVNAKNPITEEDVPQVAEETVDTEGYQVDARILGDLEEMFAAARAAGRNPLICSAFRAWDTQQSLHENKIQRVMNEEGLNRQDAAVKAGTVVAVPGTSEHQIGLAIDIVSSEYGNLDEGQMETEDQKWLIENCWKYGFILRYPLDQSDITGIIFEPWHYRYVGKKAAKEITEQGITLEEYLGAEPVGNPEDLLQ